MVTEMVTSPRRGQRQPQRGRHVEAAHHSVRDEGTAANQAQRRSGRPRPAGVTSDRERIVRRYTDEAELRGVVAYAEVRAIMLAWAGLHPTDPEVLARLAIAAVIRGRGQSRRSSDAFGSEVRATLRRMTAAALARAGKRLGPSPWNTLGNGQLGDVDGLETVFHVAAEAALGARADDPAIMAAAKALAEYVRIAVTAALDSHGNVP